jgi:hypothetical protein
LLVGLAEHQADVLTRNQALALGLSRHSVGRLVESGQWRAMARGLYYTLPHDPPWLALAWAGVLLGGDEARLGGRAAGHLHKLIATPPETVEVLIPQTQTVTNREPWTFRREPPGRRSPRSVGSPPRLGIADTVVDLCSASTESQVVSHVTTAVQRRLVSPERLLRTLSERPRVRHRALLVGLLSDVADGVESPLELSYLVDVERPHGLPKGNRQQSRAGFPYCSDVGYDDYQVLVELDGRDGHTGVGRFRDMRRDNRFAFVDWLTLRYGWFDVVDHPCAVAWQVGAALGNRGWMGYPRRCRRCLAVPEEELRWIA